MISRYSKYLDDVRLAPLNTCVYHLLLEYSDKKMTQAVASMCGTGVTPRCKHYIADSDARVGRQDRNFVPKIFRISLRSVSFDGK